MSHGVHAVQHEVEHQIEHDAEHGGHGHGDSQTLNKRVALLIAVIALFLAFAETLGKSAQTEAIDANVRASDAWAFFQAKDVRKTTVLTAADQTALLAAGLSDPAAKAAVDKQIETWRKTAERYESDPKNGNGRKELAERAKEEEQKRDLSLARYHHYELSSAAFQIGIVLASAAVITEVMGLAWFAGFLGVGGLVLLGLGLFAPHFLPLA